MGWTLVPDKAAGDVFTAAMWNNYIAANINTGLCVQLADTVLVGTSAAITFASIPQAFSHLRIVGYARTDGAVTVQDMLMRFNGDSGANYDRQYLSGAVSTAAAGESFGTTGLGVSSVPGASAAANLFAPFDIVTPYYSQGSNHKASVSCWAYKYGTASGNLGVGMMSHFWRSAAAITQVSLHPTSGNFVAGTRVTLYGMP